MSRLIRKAKKKTINNVYFYFPYLDVREVSDIIWIYKISPSLISGNNKNDKKVLDTHVAASTSRSIANHYFRMREIELAKFCDIKYLEKAAFFYSEEEKINIKKVIASKAKPSNRSVLEEMKKCLELDWTYMES